MTRRELVTGFVQGVALATIGAKLYKPSTEPPKPFHDFVDGFQVEEESLSCAEQPLGFLTLNYMPPEGTGIENAENECLWFDMPGRKSMWSATVHQIHIVKGLDGVTWILVVAEHTRRTPLQVSFHRDGKKLCDGSIKGTGKRETLRMQC